MWQLIACRALMGVGAAFIMPSTLSILVNVFPPDERTKAIAIWASVTGARRRHRPGRQRLAARPLLVRLGLPRQRADHPASRSSPAAFLVPKSKDPEQAQLDPVGAVLSIVGIVVARVRPHRGARQRLGEHRRRSAAFAIGVVVLALFVLWELHVDEPMLDMRYFRNPAFSTGTGGMILVFLAMFGVMFLITQYFQLVLGYSPLGAALRLLPMAPIMIIVAPLTPRLSRPLRRQPHGRRRHGARRRRAAAVPRPRRRTRRTAYILAVRHPARQRHRARRCRR